MLSCTPTRMEYGRNARMVKPNAQTCAKTDWTGRPSRLFLKLMLPSGDYFQVGEAFAVSSGSPRERRLMAIPWALAGFRGSTVPDYRPGRERLRTHANGSVASSAPENSPQLIKAQELRAIPRAQWTWTRLAFDLAFDFAAFAALTTSCWRRWNASNSRSAIASELAA